MGDVGGRVEAARRPLARTRRRTGGGCASAPAWGWEMGGGRTGGGLVGLDGLNRLGLESGVIWSF